MIEQLTEQVKEEIKSHALAESPIECCGLLVSVDGEIKSIKCTNMAIRKSIYFEIGAQEYLAASKEGEIIGYYHSHLEDVDARFSGSDRKISIASGFPLIMYSIKEDRLLEYIPA